MKALYIYGSENPQSRSLMHIADDTGKPLCGNLKIKYGECTAVITEIREGKIFAESFGGGKNQFASEMHLWQTHYCSMCKKRLNKILNNQ
jgi:hypothetical protein